MGVATVAGTGLKMAGDQKATSAQNAVVSANGKKQKKLMGETKDNFYNSLGRQGVGSQTAGMDAAATHRAGMYDLGTNTALGFMPTGTNPSGDATGNRVVENSYRQNAARIKQFLSQQGKSRAGVESFGDQQLANSFLNQDAANRQATISSYLNGNQAQMGLAMQDGAHAGDQLSQLGELSSGVATVLRNAKSAGAFNKNTRNATAFKGVADNGGTGEFAHPEFL
jgi:hypothetical protein